MRIVDRPPTPGRECQAGLGQREVRCDAADRQSQRRLETVAGGDPPGIGLLVGDLAVAIGVEVETRLEGRDLGLVDDDVEEDPVRLDADARVVVDREVAERMRRGQRRDEENAEDPEQDSKCPAARVALTANVRGHCGSTGRVRDRSVIVRASQIMRHIFGHAPRIHRRWPRRLGVWDTRYRLRRMNEPVGRGASDTLAP